MKLIIITSAAIALIVTYSCDTNTKGHKVGTNTVSNGKVTKIEYCSVRGSEYQCKVTTDIKTLESIDIFSLPGKELQVGDKLSHQYRTDEYGTTMKYVCKNSWCAFEHFVE